MSTESRWRASATRDLKILTPAALARDGKDKNRKSYRKSRTTRGTAVTAVPFSILLFVATYILSLTVQTLKRNFREGLRPFDFRGTTSQRRKGDVLVPFESKPSDARQDVQRSAMDPFDTQYDKYAHLDMTGKADEDEDAAAKQGSVPAVASVGVPAVKSDDALVAPRHGLAMDPFDTQYDKYECVPCHNATLARYRPHAYIIGAEKGGTTALLFYLQRHQDMAGLKKGKGGASRYGESYCLDENFDTFQEGPRRANNGTLKTIYQCGILRSYKSWFRDSGMDASKILAGTKYVDKTTEYLLNSHVTPQRLLCNDPDPKLIVVLRNPVDRAYSAYNMWMKHYNAGYGKNESVFWAQVMGPLGMARKTFPTFYEDITEEIGRLQKAGVLDLNMTAAEEYQAWKQFTWSRYIAQGLYHIQLRQWLAVLRDHFGPDKMMDHILIMESEASKENKQDTYDRVLDFLDLPPYDLTEGGTEEIDDRHERSYDHAMSAETREDLEAFFRPHNARLHELLSPLGVEISWAKQAYLEMQQ